MESIKLVNFFSAVYQETVENSKKLVPVLKGVITIKLSLHKISTKIQTKEEWLNFSKA